MTTSFTTTEEFDPQDEGFGGEVEYPSAFGITFTPQVSGIALGVGGLALAGYLFFTQVMPIFGELGELNKQRQEKQDQLNQLNSNQLGQVISRKQGELQEAKDLRDEVLSLFADKAILNTLLIDVSDFASNYNVKMNSYVPTGELETLADDSLGAQAVNNVQVKTYNLDIEGTFNEIQSFIQDLERLQPLLVVQNLNASTSEPAIYLFENDQLTPVGEPKLKTTLTIRAVFPALQPPPPPPEAKPPEGEKPPAK